MGPSWTRRCPVLPLIILAGIPACLPPVLSLHCSGSRSQASAILRSVSQGLESVSVDQAMPERSASLVERVRTADVKIRRKVLSERFADSVIEGPQSLVLRGGGIPVESSKRIAQDTMKLMMSNFKVIMVNETTMREFSVLFHGPKDTPYQGGVWKVNVELPVDYPFRSPSIGFGNKIFHPNVDEASGSVCLDVINQTWKPMFDLVNIFEVFLPQLLTYPNPADPLNAEAASLSLRDPVAYEKRIRAYVVAHCQGVEKEFDAEQEGLGQGRPRRRGHRLRDAASSSSSSSSSSESDSE